MVTLTDLSVDTRPCKEERFFYEYDMVAERQPVGGAPNGNHYTL